MDAPLSQSSRLPSKSSIKSTADAKSQEAVTLGELYCELVDIQGNDDPSLARWMASRCAIYPRIAVPSPGNVEGKKKSVEIDRRRSEGWRLAISSWVRYLCDAWYFDLVFRERGAPMAAVLGERPIWSRAWSWVRRRCLSEELPSELRPDPRDPVRAFAWHPYLAVFAVALRNDTVRLFHLHAADGWVPLVLRHEMQVEVTCVAWKPLSGATLAVGTSHGILIWALTTTSRMAASGTEKKNTAYRSASPSKAAFSPLPPPAGGFARAWGSARARCLSLPGGAPVSTLSWSPSGRWLASGSCAYSHVVVWDMLVEVPTPLMQYCTGGVGCLLWAPNDQFVFASTTQKQLRVWETDHWISQRWMQHGCVENVAWSSNGYHVAFTVQDDAKLYILSFLSSPASASSAVFSRQSVSTSIDVASFAPADEGLGAIAWDGTNSRLAVAIKSRPRIALFQCNDLARGAEFQFLGCIKGPQGARVTQLGFREHMENGALLGAVYSSGEVSMYPMYFRPAMEGRVARDRRR